MKTKFLPIVAAIVLSIASCAPAANPFVKYAPLAPAATSIPPAAPTTAPTVTCYAKHDYNLDPSMIEVATSGSWIHVEFWWEGQPERETLLAGPGRYTLTRSLRGHVWEYTLGCSEAQARQQVDAHIARRLGQLANNAGFVSWTTTGLFAKVVGP